MGVGGRNNEVCEELLKATASGMHNSPRTSLGLRLLPIRHGIHDARMARDQNHGHLQPCGQAADHPRQRCNGFDTKFTFLAKETWVSWQDPSCKGNMEPSRPDHLVDTARFCIEP